MTKFTDEAVKDLGYVKAHWPWLTFAIGLVVGILGTIGVQSFGG